MDASIGHGHYSCSRGGGEVTGMVVDLYALEARTKTARYLSNRQRIWMKVVGLAFTAGFLLGVGAVIWVIVTGVPGSR